MARRLRKSELEENLSEVLTDYMEEVRRLKALQQPEDQPSALHIKAMDGCVAAHVRALAGGHFVPDELDADVAAKDPRQMLIRVEAMASRLKAQIVEQDAQHDKGDQTLQ